MNDDKMAKEYNIEGGSVLHLVRPACRKAWLSTRQGTCHAFARFAWSSKPGLHAEFMCRNVSIASRVWRVSLEIIVMGT